MQNEQVTNKLPSKMSLIVRVMVSCYLIYTVYSLGDVWNRYSGGELILYLIIMVVFGLAACIMGGLAIRDLITGKYFAGALDNSDMMKK
ncbi:MAG: hypothetical protein IJO85_03720 [Lachnospiraceae bacterium]|nr:hypothetical protein [Lachnospiraceae bacterium]